MSAWFVFALIGVAMIRYRYPGSGTVVGILLGRMLETQSILTHQISGGSLERPAAMVLMAIISLSLLSTRRCAQVEKAVVLP